MNLKLFNTSDLFVFPIVFLIAYIFIIKTKKNQPIELQKYYVPTFLLRFVGTVAIALITEYLYTYGDTYYYYYNAQMLTSFFKQNPLEWLDLLFNYGNHESNVYQKYNDLVRDFDLYTSAIYSTPENAFLSNIASFFNLFFFNSYLSISFVFGTLSFIGCWNIFKTANFLFPGCQKNSSIFCLLLPSLWFWGAGILKDPICLYALGVFIYNFFVNKSTLFKRLILMALCLFMLYNLKSYIAISLVISLVLTYLFKFFMNLGNVQKIASLTFLLFGIIVFFSQINNFIQSQIEDLASQAQLSLKIYIELTTEGGSLIDLNFEPTIPGLISQFFQSFLNVYFRPYLWEIKKIVYIFPILENLLLLYVIFSKVKSPINSIKIANKFFPLFCIIFAILLGFIIGVTTFNLGTISRYRLPALPFIFMGIYFLKLNRKFKKEKLKNSLAPNV